jgi:hypothetical protein
MILGELDSYMSAIDYINESRKKDVTYANYVQQALNFVQQQLSSLNEYLVKKGRLKCDAEIRIKNSDVINAEISVFAFYINTGVFSACYNLELTKYKFMFKSTLIQNILSRNPIEFPSSFIINHELSHIYRAHGDVENTNINENLFVRATEMDADLLSVAKLYRGLQSNLKNIETDDSEIRCLVLLSSMEALGAMQKHSNGFIYQKPEERLWDIILKLSHLKEDPESHIPVDVNGSSDTTRNNLTYLMDFIMKYKESSQPDDPIVLFIDNLLNYIMSSRQSGTISAWSKIKENVSITSKTQV